MPEKHWGTNSVPPDVATKSARPHTAHGLRESDIAKGRSEAAPVVAGARGMMRYNESTVWQSDSIAPLYVLAHGEGWFRL